MKMKNKKFWYILIAFATCVLVASIVLIPGVLLNNTEEGTLGSLHIVSDGNYSSQQNGSNGASKSPSSTVASEKQLAQRVQLFEQHASDSVLSREYADDGMGMKEAVDTCIRQITLLLNKGMILPSDGFPQAYTVSAEPRTITDDHGNAALQYWNIVFTVKTASSTVRREVAVSLDAQTGMLLSMYITLANDNTMVDLVNIAEVIAQGMNMPGKLLSLNQQQMPQTALWLFNNSELVMQLTLAKRAQLTIFVMTIGTNGKLSSPPLSPLPVPVLN